MAGPIQVAGGFSQMIRAGSTKDETGARKGRQFRLKLNLPEELGSVQVRRAMALSRLDDIVAMRDALVAVGRGAKAEYLMRKAGAVADDPEKFAFAIAAANVVMTRPSERANEASDKWRTWGQLATAWYTGELDRLYPNAGYGKKTSEDTDKPKVEYLSKFIGDVPLQSFSDDDYWRAMRPARARSKTDSTFKHYSQVCRRVLKIAVELKIIPAWPLSAVCKLPKIAKGSAPEFPFLYPEEYVLLVRCEDISFEYRVLYGFILREGPRISEAFRIQWEHLEQLPNGRWLLNVPETKTGRALMFILMPGTGEAIAELRRRRPDLPGPFAWMSETQVKKAAAKLREHIELSGTTRDRLLYTNGRLRRMREHDLRSTFVTWCKLAGIDNETISQHTGHESSTMIARYNRSKATLEHLGLPPYLPLDEAMGLTSDGAVAPRSRGPAALNGRDGCDAGCDGGPIGACHPVPEDCESSMITALCAREDSNLHALRRRNLNPRSSDQRAQTSAKTPYTPAPEDAGSDRVSHPGVTLGLRPDQLQELLDLATKARRWHLVTALGEALDALAHTELPNVTSLDAARRKRGRGEP
jgi:integrase